MRRINIKDTAGEFAENKDVARDLREQVLLPALAAGEEVTIDFSDCVGATQSFVHALISEAFRIYGNDILDRIVFKDCNETVQKIITIVAEYMQEST